MSDTHLLLATLALAIAAMGAFALTVTAHRRQILGARPRASASLVALRAPGSVLLARSFALCATADPILMAVLVWPMLLMVAAGVIAAALTLHARISARS